MLRKDKGLLDQFLPAMIILVLMAVLWTGSMVSAANIDRSSDIHQTARTCMLRMESDGYLTEENRQWLLSALEDLDMEQIDLTGTTVSDVGYGNPIRLVIRGRVNLADIRFRGFASAMMTTRQAKVAINKVSVAKN